MADSAEDGVGGIAGAAFEIPATEISPSQSWLGLSVKAFGFLSGMPGGARAIADVALGFWKAVAEVWGKAREQNCRVHKAANVLNKLPKSEAPKIKTALQNIWMAETRKDDEAALNHAIELHEANYDNAVACLIKDRKALLAFCNFRAKQWKHLRTTNPIENTFATVRHRTIRSKGCLSNKTALATLLKRAGAAQKCWRRLNGHNRLPKLIRSVKDTDGIEAMTQDAQTAVT